MYRSMLVSVYSALSVAAVWALTLPAQAQIVSAPPIGYWNFDSSTAADLTDNHLDGTLNGGATFSSDVPNIPGLQGGMSLQLMSAANPEAPDPSSDWVDLGNPTLLDFGMDQDFTIAGWIKTDQAVRGNFFSNGGDDGGGVRYVLALGETGGAGVVVLTTDNDTDKRQAVGMTPANDGEWHHIAAVREGTTSRVYLDGVEEGANTDLPPGYDLSGTSQQNAYIGVGYSQANSVNIKQLGGLYDDVAVWDVALPVSDIEGLANGTLSVMGGSEFILGDFNGDGVVDNGDFVVLSDNLAGQLDGPVTHDQGDIDFDRDVDLDDFGQFKALFAGALGQAQAIPEPASVTLLACIAVVLSLVHVGRRGKRLAA